MDRLPTEELKMKKNVLVFTVFFFLGLSAVLGATPGYNFDWDANQEPDLAGYKIYFATFSLLNKSTEAARANPNVRYITLDTSTGTALPLVNGATYFFRLTAYDTTGNESGFNIKSPTEPVPHEISVFFKRGDVNQDGVVDVFDLGIMTKEWDQ